MCPHAADAVQCSYRHVHSKSTARVSSARIWPAATIEPRSAASAPLISVLHPRTRTGHTSGGETRTRGLPADRPRVDTRRVGVIPRRQSTVPPRVRRQQAQIIHLPSPPPLDPSGPSLRPLTAEEVKMERLLAGGAAGSVPAPAARVGGSTAGPESRERRVLASAGAGAASRGARGGAAGPWAAQKGAPETAGAPVGETAPVEGCRSGPWQLRRRNGSSCMSKQI